jgi:DNA-3-methyladenine glycosylase
VSPGRLVPRAWLARSSVRVAPALIGCRLVRVLPDGTRLSGRIVEVEAYLGVRDRASHAFGGRRTPRNESMYARAGTAYVYFTYGMHHCVNVVLGREGEPLAVLIRALEPLEGVDHMTRLRGDRPARDLCRGPGNLCRALSIDRALDGVDLCRPGVLTLERAPAGPGPRLALGPRVGIGFAGEWAARPLRWMEAGSPYGSRPGL